MSKNNSKTLGEIVSFDPVTQYAVVKLLCNTVNNNLMANYHNVDAPILVDVPVEFPKMGGFCITMEPQAGDDCIVEFFDSGITHWLYENRRAYKVEKGRPEPAALRRFSLQDAACRVGISNEKTAIGGFGGGLQLRSLSGKQKVALMPDGKIIIEAEADIEIKTTGTLRFVAKLIEMLAGKISMRKQ